MKKSILVLVSLLMVASLMLGACKSTNPAASPTSTPQETSTLAPTPTITPTHTPTPKPTPTPIPSPTPTPTPTVTPAPTQEPPVQSESDFEKLTDALVIISGGSEQSWDQSAVETAKSILSQEQYSAEDWQAFFSEFFTGHPAFTDGLRSYLGYPVFEWSSETSQHNLQAGLVKPLLDLIDSFMNKYGDSLDSILPDNAVQRDTLMNAHRFINALVSGSWYTPPETETGLPEKYRQEVYQFYIDLVEKYPTFRIDARIDPVNQPYLGAIRAQVYMNLRDAVPLTTAIKIEIGNTLILKARYSTIWHSSSVLVIDNLDLDNLQLSVIEAILKFIPDSIHDLEAITVNDSLGNTGTKYMWFMTKYAVDISDIPVGTEQDHYFPSDISSAESDVFSMMVVNEIHRAIDAYLSNNDSVFKSRKDRLIEQAGNYPDNYLGNMFAEGFINPQDFFPSIGIRWFSSTKDTLELAVSRFDSGFEGPINQFLFFANIYLIESDSEGDRVPFFSIDTNGAVTRTRVSVERDEKGRIVSLRYGSYTYSFTLDNNGNVILVTKE